MVEVEAPADAAQIDLDGVVDETTGIRYLGKATRRFDGCWVCLADVGGALCLVEMTVRPTIRADTDPGDEDDRGERDRQLDRDLARTHFRVYHPSSRRVAAHAETLGEARKDAEFWSKQTPNPIEIQERFPSGAWVTIQTVQKRSKKRAHATMKKSGTAPKTGLPVREGVTELEYHRPPTAGEIRFGHGATHYRTFPLEECCYAGTRIPKKWIVASDDGLRYYR